MAARLDPTRMKSIHPTTITATLRRLSQMDDDTFMRVMRPVAEATELPAYKGKADTLLREMLERKKAAPSDFETYFKGEVDRMLKGPRAADVPSDWRVWAQSGGHFNLNATPEDLWREHLAELEAKFGKFSAAAYTAVVARLPEEVKAVLDQYIDGGLRAWRQGQSIGGHGYIVGSRGATITDEMATRARGIPTEGQGYQPQFIPALAPQQQYEDWLELQQWALLSIANGAAGPRGASYDATLRQMWDPATGSFLVVRGSGRFSSPKAAFDDLRQSGGKVAKSYATPGAGFSGLKTHARLSYKQFITTNATDISRGESEWIARDIRAEQVIRITTGHSMSVQDLLAWIAAGKGPLD
jgi:hypothetical protein